LSGSHSYPSIPSYAPRGVSRTTAIAAGVGGAVVGVVAYEGAKRLLTGGSYYHPLYYNNYNYYYYNPYNYPQGVVVDNNTPKQNQKLCEYKIKPTDKGLTDLYVNTTEIVNDNETLSSTNATSLVNDLTKTNGTVAQVQKLYFFCNSFDDCCDMECCSKDSQFAGEYRTYNGANQVSVPKLTTFSVGVMILISIFVF